MAAPIKTLAASHRVKAGKRYIFFQSLQNYDSWWYPQLYKQGLGYVEEAKQQLRPDVKLSNEDDLNRIKDYINYIKELADQEAKNEINFINQFKNTLNKLEDGNLKKRMLEFIDSLNNGDLSNYSKYLSLLNTILINNQAFAKQRQEVARESMGFIDEVYNLANGELQTQISEALAREDYGEYQKLIRSAYPETQDNMVHKFSGAISTKFADKFNSIVRQVADDSELLDIISQAWLSAPANGINLNNIKLYIAAAIAEYLKNFSFEDLKNKEVREIVKDLKTNPQFLTNLINTISNEYASNIWNLLEGKKVVEKTLEELALTTRRGLGDQFLRLNQSSQQDIVQLYGKYGFDQKVFNMISKVTNPKRKAALITEKLGKAIRLYAKKAWGVVVKDKYSKEQREAIEEALKNNIAFQTFQQKLKRQINPGHLKNQLQVKMKGPASAEAMAADIIKKLSPKDIIILIGGGQIQEKADVSFTYTGDLDFSQIFDNAAIGDNIKSMTSRFHEDFIRRNYAQIGDKIATNVKIANFKAEMEEISNEIKKYLQQFYTGDDLDKKISQTLEQLNNLIIGGIQVKEYVHGGTLGFMGESLGENGAKILENIDQMYDVGGISRIDYELLYFVMANCGVDGLAVDLKGDLAKYLLGGAMMILFDEGFTASTKFLDDIKKEFAFAPSTVHLFNLQGGHFVPASFAYNSIYNNLLQVYTDIMIQTSQRVDTGKANSQVHIFNNITEENDKPNWHDVPKAQQRWDMVKKLADSKKKIDIKITFLAGILDMFEAIPEAFNI